MNDSKGSPTALEMKKIKEIIEKKVRKNENILFNTNIFKNFSSIASALIFKKKLSLNK